MGTIDSTAFPGMNHRDYKEFAAGECYHLFNRGTGKMDIFRDSEDYRFLLQRLGEYLNKNTMVPIVRRKTFDRDSFSLLSYCLMPNHFHFLMRQNNEESLSALMLNLWSGYSKYFNRKYERVGALFQDQFKAVHIGDDAYLRWLSAYIHLNPVTARITRDARDYQYSSYNEYLDPREGSLSDPQIVLEQFPNVSAYRRFVQDSAAIIRERHDFRSLLIDYV